MNHKNSHDIKTTFFKKQNLTLVKQNTRLTILQNR